MPCSDGGPSYDDGVYTRLNKATKAACELGRLLQSVYSENGYDWELLVSESTKRWVRRHEEVDRKRIAREKKDNEDRARRREILAKLTKEERRILGNL